MAPQATGKVIRLFTHRTGTNIRLDIESATAPKDTYFRLRLDHPNYNALYSLALAAAANRWPLRIRIDGDVPINRVELAVVMYFTVDWEAGQGEDDD